MNKLQYYLFWRKWKNKYSLIRGNPKSSKGVSVEFYSIAPNSFKISWNNYQRLK